MTGQKKDIKYVYGMRERETKKEREMDKGKITVNTYFHEQIWRHNGTHDKWTQSIYWQRYEDESGGSECQSMVSKWRDLSI